MCLGNASFVNENKVLDSELNYVVSVMVNNDMQGTIEEMEFQDIPGLPLDRFTGTCKSKQGGHSERLTLSDTNT